MMSKGVCRPGDEDHIHQVVEQLDKADAAVLDNLSVATGRLSEATSKTRQHLRGIDLLGTVPTVALCRVEIAKLPAAATTSHV